MLRQPWFNFGLAIDGDIKQVIRMTPTIWRYLQHRLDWETGQLTLSQRRWLWRTLERSGPLPTQVMLVVSREAIKDAISRVLGKSPPHSGAGTL